MPANFRRAPLGPLIKNTRQSLGARRLGSNGKPEPPLSPKESREFKDAAKKLVGNQPGFKQPKRQVPRRKTLILRTKRKPTDRPEKRIPRKAVGFSPKTGKWVVRRPKK